MFFNSKTNLLKRVGKIFLIGVILTSVFLQIFPEKFSALAANETLPTGDGTATNDLVGSQNDSTTNAETTNQNSTGKVGDQGSPNTTKGSSSYAAAKTAQNIGFWGMATGVGQAGMDIGKAWATGKVQRAPIDNTGACIIWDRHGSYGAADAGANFPNCFAQLLYVGLAQASWFVALAGLLFNAVFDLTVVNISEFVKQAGIIKVGWTLLRDISNILFIFILLYLAIATILQLDEHGVKHSLSRLIIAAVLINFSLFFTKIVIDVPNLIAIKVYDKIIVTDPKTGKKEGLGNAFLTIFAPQQALLNEDGSIINPNSVKATGSWNEGAKNLATNKNPIITFLMAIILDVFVIFVFLAVIIIFLKRFVILIFLMIFSPLAFAGMAVPMPSIEHAVKDKFWNTLFKEAFYAPIFMICVYITLETGKGVVKGNIAMPGEAFSWSSSIINMPYILSFSVVIVMLVASLIIAEEIGVSGASGAMSAYKGMKGMALGAVGGAAGWAGANTFGSIAHNWVNKGKGADFRLAAGGIASSNKFANLLSKNFIGRQIAKTITSGADAVSTNTFGGKKSYKELVDTEEHDIEEALHERHMSDDDMAKLFLEGSKLKAGRRRNAIDRVFDKTDSARLASIGLRMKDPDIVGTHGTDDRYFTGNHGHPRLAGDKALDVERKQSGSILSYHRDRFKRLSSDQLPADKSGHIHPKTDAQVTTDWATIRNDFQNYGDKQKAELLSTLNKVEQDALATPTTATSTPEQTSIKNNFKSLIADNIKTFKQSEQAYNGAMVTDAMKETIDNVAFAGLARARIADVYESRGMPGFNDSVVATNQFRDELKKLDAFRGMAGIDTMDMASLIGAYKAHDGGKLVGGDKTFVKAKETMTRVLTETSDYRRVDDNIK